MKKDYLNYNSIELASEESFIAWVKHQADNEKWLNFLDDNPDFYPVAVEAKSLIKNQVYEHTVLTETKKNELWGKIDAATSTYEATISTTSKSNPRKIITYAGSAAAVILLFLYLTNSFGGSYKTVNSDLGSDMLVSLPDRSTIKLNAQSLVKYDETDFHDKRILNLSGEAFFQVEKGSRFTVELDHGSVEVLGTSFNIFSRNDSMAVHCYTGKVQVRAGNNTTVLTPGESLSYAEKSGALNEKTFIMNSSEPAWTKGIFQYERASLRTILDEMSRQFGVSFRVEKKYIYDEVIENASFNNGNLDKALEEILWTQHLQYDIENDEVRIYK